MNNYKQFCTCQGWSMMVPQAPYTTRLYRRRRGLILTNQCEVLSTRGYLLELFIYSLSRTLSWWETIYRYWWLSFNIRWNCLKRKVTQKKAELWDGQRVRILKTFLGHLGLPVHDTDAIPSRCPLRHTQSPAPLWEWAWWGNIEKSSWKWASRRRHRRQSEVLEPLVSMEFVLGLLQLWPKELV